MFSQISLKTYIFLLKKNLKRLILVLERKAKDSKIAKVESEMSDWVCETDKECVCMSVRVCACVYDP